MVEELFRKYTYEISSPVSILTKIKPIPFELDLGYIFDSFFKTLQQPKVIVWQKKKYFPYSLNGSVHIVSDFVLK